MPGRIGFTLRKTIWVLLKLAGWTWLVSIPLLAPAVIAAAIFKYTPVPWIGGNLFLTGLFTIALAIAIKINRPVWPTDEEIKELQKFGNSSSSTRSTGKTASQQTGWKDPVDPEDPMEGMHMGGETELAAHESWETVEESPYNDPDDAPGGLDTADDDGF